MFLLPIGRTNTEYFTMNPVYGCNLNHHSHGAKVTFKYYLDNQYLPIFCIVWLSCIVIFAQLLIVSHLLILQGSQVAVATSDCVELCVAESQRRFYAYDTTDRDTVTRWHHQQHVMARAQSAFEGRENSSASTSMSATSSQSHSHSQSQSGSSGSSGSHSQGNQHLRDPQRSDLGAVLRSVLPLPPADFIHTASVRQAHFYRFISTCEKSSVLFEVYAEDPSSGHRKR